MKILRLFRNKYLLAGASSGILVALGFLSHSLVHPTVGFLLYGAGFVAAISLVLFRVQQLQRHLARSLVDMSHMGTRAAQDDVPVSGRAAGIGTLIYRGPQSVFRQFGGANPNGIDSIFTIITEHLSEYLDTEYNLIPVRPKQSQDLFHSGLPFAVVIEQEALRQGSWFGAESASGMSLSEELTIFMSSLKKYDVPVYFVHNSLAADVNTEDIIESASIIIPTEERHPENPRQTSLLQTLDRYVSREE